MSESNHRLEARQIRARSFVLNGGRALGVLSAGRTTGGRPPSLTPRSPLRAGPGQGTHGTLFRCNFVSSRKYNSEPFLLHFAILRDPHPRPRTRPGQAAPPQIFQKMGGRWAEDNVTIGFIFFVQNTIVQNKSVLLVSLAGAGSEARPKSERRPPTPAGPVPSGQFRRRDRTPIFRLTPVLGLRSLRKNGYVRGRTLGRISKQKQGLSAAISRFSIQLASARPALSLIERECNRD